MRRILVVGVAVVGLALATVHWRPAKAQEVPAPVIEAREAPAPEVEVREPDVVFVPTPRDVMDRMFQLARVRKDDIVYDLGCGDGRIVVEAAKRLGCKAWGFDIDPERVKESLENVKKNKVEHLVTIKQKDIFQLDLRPASVVMLYLLPELNVQLIPQLEKLKPGSRIVSHDFDMEGCKPEKIIKMESKEDGMDHEIFLWTIPFTKAPVPKDEQKEEEG